MLYLFDIGFLPVRIWDILDILIVGYLMYQIYKLLRGNIAFNIFIGVLMMYVAWWLVNQLEMDLLAAVLGQFVSVGVIIIIIIFQPEVRRFLLFLGKTTLRQRSNFVGRIIDRNLEDTEEKARQLRAMRSALLRMAKKKTGALIVLAGNLNLEGLVSSGITLNSEISEPMLESIFNKESPLHDGAVLISNGKILSASCILPVSENPNLPPAAGLRHRAAVGITERADVPAFIVSEETGFISFALEGKLTRDIDEDQLMKLLNEYF
ncbi:MAG: diadenylate cyclase CdaA [Phaeodactylibacter sp.]|nr:diadenylate cyclase CdaA [Phaeodactylibacter sp.]MCB9301004.1 TIGR00159 family protein [Lewinellaceae bacterium]